MSALSWYKPRIRAVNLPNLQRSGCYWTAIVTSWSASNFQRCGATYTLLEFHPKGSHLLTLHDNTADRNKAVRVVLGGARLFGFKLNTDEAFSPPPERLSMRLCAWYYSPVLGDLNLIQSTASICCLEAGDWRDMGPLEIRPGVTRMMSRVIIAIADQGRSCSIGSINTKKQQERFQPSETLLLCGESNRNTASVMSENFNPIF